MINLGLIRSYDILLDPDDKLFPDTDTEGMYAAEAMMVKRSISTQHKNQTNAGIGTLEQ